MIKDLRLICKNNEFHSRFVLFLLYFEKAALFKLPFSILRKIVIQMVYNCQIHPESFVSLEAIATCRLPHPYLIIIHRTCLIGTESVIFHDVTVGLIEGRGDNKAAIIGNCVYIGCKASILGNVRIANGVKIGAHSLILGNINNINQTVTGIYKNNV